MADENKGEATGSTILTEPEKKEAAPEAKVYPTPEQKAEKEAADKAAAEKAAADEQAAAKAKADAEAAEKAKAEAATKGKEGEGSPTETEKAEAEKARLNSQKEYDLKLPPDSPLTDEDLTALKKEATEAKLSKEQAEGLLKARNEGAIALKTRQDQAFEQTKIQWKEQVANDPEMGGDKLAETTETAKRAFKALASAELQIWAEKTGLGSYPEFVRLMARVGRMMGEDKLVPGSNGTPPAKKSPEEILYGKTTPK